MTERMQRFRAWVVDELAAGAARGELSPIDPGVGFAIFFSLYLGLLLAGLNGVMSRAAQRATLREVVSAPRARRCDAC